MSSNVPNLYPPQSNYAPSINSSFNLNNNLLNSSSTTRNRINYTNTQHIHDNINKNRTYNTISPFNSYHLPQYNYNP